jgi:hypothetical protein
MISLKYSELKYIADSVTGSLNTVKDAILNYLRPLEISKILELEITFFTEQ